jgi:hypothetical protein
VRFRQGVIVSLRASSGDRIDIGVQDGPEGATDSDDLPIGVVDRTIRVVRGILRRIKARAE